MDEQWHYTYASCDLKGNPESFTSYHFLCEPNFQSTFFKYKKSLANFSFFHFWSPFHLWFWKQWLLNDTNYGIEIEQKRTRHNALKWFLIISIHHHNIFLVIIVVAGFIDVDKLFYAPFFISWPNISNVVGEKIQLWHISLD